MEKRHRGVEVSPSVLQTLNEKLQKSTLSLERDYLHPMESKQRALRSLQHYLFRRRHHCASHSQNKEEEGFEGKGEEEDGLTALYTDEEKMTHFPPEEVHLLYINYLF